MTFQTITRRALAALLPGVIGMPGRLRALARACRPSVEADEGPFYPVGDIPTAFDLTRRSARGPAAVGARLLLFGEVRNAECRPVAGATVEIWQADPTGHYDHPRAEAPHLDAGFRYFAKAVTGPDGRYRFLTLQPGAYRFMGLDRAPHIHVKVHHSDHRALTTEVYFENPDGARRRLQDRVFLGRGPRRDEMVAPYVPLAEVPDLPPTPSDTRACRCHFELVARTDGR